ncbi:winged helix-turn-helix transcriptional regulator [Phytoactinopolyspora halotolerans]|uniref:Winged helix-turn-helix transcriptional regulator n=1 Tax=Phytoactinopolyspora halotolerans TaxID=1981512 RepID=A0A6L9SCD3_9ACTN|nr:winged helix-turn-helix transcriptional regulator [Phytoactinopolyspora halotolerans]NEE02733.1 winged helix-turn-helix transcriptional regulator [Phytoactinopolyspora halotolerans]
MLQAAGVGKFDERIYRALLRRPSASVAELADSGGTTASRTRRALRRLEHLGLVRRTETNRVAPVAPDAALAALIQRREAELGQVRAEIIELAEEYRTGRIEAHPEGLIEVVTGQETISRRARELNDGAQSEALVFDKPPYVFQPGDHEVAAERPLLERGVRARVIYSREAVSAPQRLTILARLAALGEESRVLPDLPFKLRIYDRRVALVPLTTDRQSTDSVAIVHQSSLLTALIALFDAYWEQAQPVTDGTGDRPAELTDDDVAVLRLLSTGLKDEAIARQLGVSLRTLRRRVLRVMDLLHASTRFQAGAQAMRRGWI